MQIANYTNTDWLIFPLHANVSVSNSLSLKFITCIYEIERKLAIAAAGRGYGVGGYGVCGYGVCGYGVGGYGVGGYGVDIDPQFTINCSYF